MLCQKKKYWFALTLGFAALVGSAGCVGGTGEEGLLSGPYGGVVQSLENLDESARALGDTHELAMRAGRLNKVPISWAFQGSFEHRASEVARETIFVRARCTTASAARDVCDPTLLVAVHDTSGTLVDVLFNNDAAAAEGNGYGAYVGVPQRAGTARRYTVIAASHNRGTSRVDIDWDATPDGQRPQFPGRLFVDSLDGQTTVPNRRQHVGGTLVRLAPVSVTDNFNVRTEDDGVAADSGTRMWLFNPTLRKFASVDRGPSASDADPSFAFDATWTCDARCAEGKSADTFALVSKDRPSSAAPEVWVDLVQSISGGDTLRTFSFGSCAGDANRPSCVETSSTSFGAGAYFFSVFASAQEHAVGDVPALDGYPHPGVETGDTIACGSIDRGQGNDLAFTLELEQDGKIVLRRQVPRGALGASGRDATGRFLDNRVTLAHEVPADGRSHQIRLHLRNVAPSVLVRQEWAARRNPESVSLKVAALNIEYDDPDLQKRPEMDNAVDLLGGGPNYAGSAVTYKDNRGKFRWEADIIALSEILPSRGSWMEERLAARTELSWERSEGESISQGSNRRRGPVFANHFARRGGGAASFGSLLDDVAGCSSANNHCALHTVTGPVPDCHYSTIPARGAMRRMKGSTGGFLELPIGVFNVYLPYADDEIGDRDAATTTLVTRMKALLSRDPRSFNRTGSSDPRDPGNRFIILGDSNMQNQQCSEVNGLLRKLREAFGYAVDVSMAVTDEDDRTFDMHYSGAPLTDFRTGTYGSCRDGNWSKVMPWGTSRGCPFHYENYQRWKEDPAHMHDTGLDQWYAWWGATAVKDGGSGSRLDIIVLAGLGWADDDPVLEYLPMPNTDLPNPGNGFEAAGVELRAWCSDTQTVSLSNPLNYEPENPICPGQATTAPGNLAYRSDHKPVGARLRSQFYR